MKTCNQCGKCCVKYGHDGLSVTDDEIEMWEFFNPEISEYIVNGKTWFHPETGKPLDICPWLTKLKGEEKYICEIYFDRPDDCKYYPTSIPEMIRDECEMIEAQDITDMKKAQKKLDQLMADSRPALQ